MFRDGLPAAFGRLCVETAALAAADNLLAQPPSGGCVLKLLDYQERQEYEPSRLRAAVC